MDASVIPARSLVSAVVFAVLATPLAAQRRADLAVAPSSRVRVMVAERPPGKVVGDFLAADSIGVHVIDPATGVRAAARGHERGSIDLFAEREVRLADSVGA